jgi:hypothetical protein
VIKDWRFWLGAVATMVGVWLYSLAHEMAARDWVRSVVEASQNPDGPPANVSHGWAMPAQGTEAYFWAGLALMLGGVIMMIWSARRSRIQ